jgi:hypothetical protein
MTRKTVLVTRTGEMIVAGERVVGLEVELTGTFRRDDKHHGDIALRAIQSPLLYVIVGVDAEIAQSVLFYNLKLSPT